MLTQATDVLNGLKSAAAAPAPQGGQTGAVNTQLFDQILPFIFEKISGFFGGGRSSAPPPPAEEEFVEEEPVE